MASIGNKDSIGMVSGVVERLGLAGMPSGEAYIVVSGDARAYILYMTPLTRYQIVLTQLGDTVKFSTNGCEFENISMKEKGIHLQPYAPVAWIGVALACLPVIADEFQEEADFKDMEGKPVAILTDGCPAGDGAAVVEHYFSQWGKL